jgi:hypothetical protein
MRGDEPSAKTIVFVKDGQFPAAFACNCCSSVQMPGALLDEVVGGVAEITPPL